MLRIKWIYLWQLFLLGHLPLAATAQHDQDCHATLFGTVIEAGSNEPVPYAEVFIVQTGQGAVTDEKGRFAFAELCEGRYTVTCHHIGCSHLSKEIELVGEMNLGFELQHEAFDLAEIVVHEKAIELVSAQSDHRLEGIALDAAKGQSVGDLLKNLPGVTTLNTGGSIVKPVIRGLHSNRVVMLNNGVRQEGQQWGADHAPEIDPFLADQVTVVYGANSVRYGAGALGGVVLVEPKPLREQKGWGGEANLAGFSNGRAGAAALLLDGKTGGKLPIAGRFQGSARRAGNLRTPGYFLENTGLRELNYAASLGTGRGNWHAEVFFSQFFTDIGIFKGSHIGNLTDLENAIERGRPLTDGVFAYQLGRPLQRAVHYLFKAKTVWETGRTGKLTVQYARQFNRRQEFDAHRRYGEVPAGFSDPDMLFEITTHTLDAAWEHKSWRHFTGSFGGQLLAQRNTTDRGGLIPDFTGQNAGIFWIERWRRHPFPVELEAGLRFDVASLNVEGRGNETIDKQLVFNNLSGTFGAIYQPVELFDLRFHIGTAWRAPSVNELYSDGVHHGTASYEKGRDDLRPERAVSTSLSLVFDNQRSFSANLSLYQNLVDGFIFLEPQANPVLTIRGAFPSFAYAQTDARLTGLDWTATWSPLPVLVLSSGASVLRAWNRKADDWLVLMPADRFKFGVGYVAKKGETTKRLGEKPFAKLTLERVLRQTRVPDGQDFAPPPAAYSRLDLEAGTSFVFSKKAAEPIPGQAPDAPVRVQLSLTVQNLFNTAYRDYLNRLRYFSDEAGRNLALRATIDF